MKGGRGLGWEAVLVQKGSARARNPGGCESKRSGSTLLTQKSQTAGQNGEGDSTAHDL